MEETKKKGSGTTDLTIGRPLTRILQFALPLVLGTLFQQLYSFVDTIIVGRCISTDALGAVGTTYSLNFMIVGFVLATCNGFGIPVAESFGAKDRDDLHKYLFNGAVLCVVMSLVFAVVTTLVAAPLLQLIHTPAELLENAVRYIRIIFLGIPATVLYNDSSTVLRSLGDSKHPLHAAGPWLQRTGRHLRRRRAHRPRSRRLAGRAPAGLSRHLHLKPPRLGLCPVLLRVHGHTGAEKGEPGGINQNQKSAPRFCTAERFFGGKLS